MLSEGFDGGTVPFEIVQGGDIIGPAYRRMRAVRGRVVHDEYGVQL